MNNSDFPFGIIFGCFFLAFCLVIGVVVFALIKRAKRFSKDMFNTESLSEGINRQRERLSEEPRSLHAMTSIYLPQIMRDFPEFDYELYKNKARSLLLSYFNAIESKNASALAEEYSPTLKSYVEGIISDLKSREVSQVYDQAVFHDTQIAKYKKDGKTATIVFEISVGYYSYITDRDGAVVFGDKSLKTQTVYETELTYVQDAQTAGISDNALGINCPNCGAPVKNLGHKFCEFCGCGITEINLRCWKFNAVKEQTVQRRQFS